VIKKLKEPAPGEKLFDQEIKPAGPEIEGQSGLRAREDAEDKKERRIKVSSKIVIALSLL